MKIMGLTLLSVGLGTYVGIVAYLYHVFKGESCAKEEGNSRLDGGIPARPGRSVGRP